MQFAPLDFRDAQVQAHRSGFDAAPEIAEGVRPAAHVEGQVFVEAGVVADVFEQIFEAARRPGEEPVNRFVLGGVLFIDRQPVFGE